jgi:copper chaperone NosL
MLQSLMEGEKLAGTHVDEFYATSYEERGKLMLASSATFLVSTNLPSPMGAGVTAFAHDENASQMQRDKGGDIMDWNAVGNYVRSWSKS